MEILGNLVEASSISINSPYYGSLHGRGHSLIAYVHDPDNKYLESAGVMGAVSTAMRDPAFYRWHKFINNVLTLYKDTQPKYVPDKDFAFPGITVKSVELKVTKGKNAVPNVLPTYWQSSEFDMSTGLDFAGDGQVFVQFIHLQYAPFEYSITVNNTK